MARVLVASAPFKGTLSAFEATAAIAQPLRESGHAVVERPLPDGGEGTLDALATAWRLRRVEFVVDGVLGAAGPTAVAVGRGVVDGVDTAVIESALCVGLGLVPPARRDPESASSAALGHLIAAAVDDGARRVCVALGGTATVDGGAGLLSVLPVLPSADSGIELLGLVDVDAPLCGPRGARLYFAQKGLPAPRHDVVEERLRALHPRFVDTPGAGAAGGLGAGVLALGGVLRSGAEVVLSALGVEQLVDSVDVIVGGEGRVDEQTLQGKSLARLRSLARRHGVRLAVVCGACDLPTSLVGDVVITLGPRGLVDARSAIVDAARALGTILSAN
jgi:glycerate kinase